MPLVFGPTVFEILKTRAARLDDLIFYSSVCSYNMLRIDTGQTQNNRITMDHRFSNTRHAHPRPRAGAV